MNTLIIFLAGILIGAFLGIALFKLENSTEKDADNRQRLDNLYKLAKRDSKKFETLSLLSIEVQNLIERESLKGSLKKYADEIARYIELQTLSLINKS